MRPTLSGPRFQAAILATLAAASLLLSACAGAVSATGRATTSANHAGGAQTTPETQRSIATAIARRAEESGTRSPGPAAPSGPRTAADIVASAPASGLLDNQHLARGVGCEACHGPLPTGGKPTTPSTTKCLACHGGSHDSVAARTANLGARNPHKAHTGRQDCDRCHYVHQPFDYSCNTCHTFPIPDKYLARR